MSYNEIHIGKLIPVNKDEDQEKVALEILKSKYPNIKDVFDDYENYGPFLSYLLQEFGDEYFLYKGILYEIEHDKEIEEENNFIENEDGSIDYNISFYNGGCGFNDAMQMFLDDENK